jgi:hypothetical protein
MPTVIQRYVLEQDKDSLPLRCGMRIIKAGKSDISGKSYRVVTDEHLLGVYEFDLPKEQLGSSGFKKLGSLPLPKEVVQYKPLPEILPEVMGAALGGALAGLSTIYAFATGLTGAGIALLGPSLAGFFGAISLWFLYRKVRD